ncbi:SDR family NAD(P)-dependent oxidoreductase [Saccharopolyspora gregorii]|uniref:SDR family NAD(P)-dependent oxidoreductase n=1 Tax=Saccharopolyspora gregorii TaxID=33914 RepID=A0ABP6RPJ4_9PSEU
MPTLDRYRFTGGTAVLTGAASGMGEQMAHQLAARGSDLVLIDRDEARLTTVADTLRATHPDRTVHPHVADLADTPALDDLAQRITTAAPHITLLINNAGVALGGTFDQLTGDEFDWVIDINFRAPVTLTRLLLPRLGEGAHIVNVSSLYGLIAPPGQSAYAASKFALRGFSDALRHELAEQGIGVTTVHPGGIRTRIAESARVASGVDEQQLARGRANYAKLLSYPADKAAAQILDGVHRRKRRVLIASSAVVPDLLSRLFPARYMDVLYRLHPQSRPSALRR